MQGELLTDVGGGGGCWCGMACCLGSRWWTVVESKDQLWGDGRTCCGRREQPAREAFWNKEVFGMVDASRDVPGRCMMMGWV